VGKTTTAINLAVGLSIAQHSTLLVDLDPQCNATSGLGQRPLAGHPLLKDVGLEGMVTLGEEGCLHLLPGSRRFQDAESLVSGAESARIRQHLLEAEQRYDYVLIDCPPSLGQLTQTALASSTEVLMPIQCEYFAMEGLTQMIDVIRTVMRRAENQLAFGGILLTMYDHTLELTTEVDAEVREFFGEVVFETVIPRDVAVSEAPSHGRSVLEHAPRSRGSRAYTELCMEVMDRD
jgi:chromosome partitioning protein